MTLGDRIKYTIVGGISCLRTRPYRGEIDYDPETGVYSDSRLYRGFPLASVGTGGFNVNANGAFQDFRINNNWMAPIQEARGCVFAAAITEGGRREARILRRGEPREYLGIRPIQHTRFRGDLPLFDLGFQDTWPLDITLSGFTPLIPHAPEDSGLPLAFLDLALHNTGAAPLQVEILLGWENLLGLGGTGQLGMRGVVAGIPLAKGRMVYDTAWGQAQHPFSEGSLEGLRFTTELDPPPGSHRRSTLGAYLLALDLPEGVTLRRVLHWDADDVEAPLIQAFAQGAPLPTAHRPGARPAGALVASLTLAPGARRTLPYTFAWWTPEHTTEADPLEGFRTGTHHGVRVGHAYEARFQGPEALIAYGREARPRLEKGSTLLRDHLRRTTLPQMLQRALLGAQDSVTCNTLWPADDTLYTLEGMDWPWYFGGLTGTNDQRLSSHVYTAHFLPTLDKSEVEAFRRLRKAGVVPHGNGNCDLGLGTSDIPYGVPMTIPGVMDDAPWPDLTLSAILQILRLVQSTGDVAWLDAAWPSLKEMVAALDGMAREGVPEGGSTYDSLTFKGTFSYTATVYLAALDALLSVARDRDPEWAGKLEERRLAAAARLESRLWEGGYYRASEDKSTLFTGALAGDWVARYGGLGGVVPFERLRSHMALQHATIVAPELRAYAKGKGWTWGTLPTMEATAEGAPRPTRIFGMKVPAYIGQIITYHAMSCIHAGLVAEGLETLELIFGRAWAGGWPFSMDLYGNAGYVYMTHPALWALPGALTGAFHDVVKETLHLAPRRLHPAQTEVWPVYMPAFWGLLTLAPGAAPALEITHTFAVAGGSELTIRRLILRDSEDNAHAVELAEALALRPGARLELPRVG